MGAAVHNKAIVKTAQGSVLAVIAALMCTVARADTQLFNAVYAGEISGWNVTLERSLTKTDEHHYVLRSQASKVVASMAEISEFDIVDQRWQPQSYRYERSIFGRDTVEAIAYDWQALEATYTRSKRERDTKTFALHTGILDPALYQIGLQIAARTAAPGSALSFEFIKRRAIKTYRFEPRGPAEVKVDNRVYAALKYEKQPADSSRTEVWLIPELDYVLGRLRHTDGDDVYEVQLERYQGNSEALAELPTPLVTNTKP